MELKIVMNNLYKVEINDLIIWFSYETPIAFRKDYQDVIISENIWTNTTGKHLNYIKQNYDYMEVDNDEFNDRLGYLSN